MHNTGLWYTSNIIRFLSVWLFSTIKANLAVGANVRWGEGGWGVSSWNISGWLSLMIVFKLPMFKWGHNSCRLVLNWGFHGVSSSSFLHQHKNSWASCLYRYHLSSNAHSHLPLGWNNGCCVYEVCTMSYHRNVWHSHHRRALEGLGKKSNTWRQNGTWVYANYHNPLSWQLIMDSK